MDPPLAESLAIAIARASAWGPGLGLVAPSPTMVFWSDATTMAPTGGLGARLPAAFFREVERALHECHGASMQYGARLLSDG